MSVITLKDFKVTHEVMEAYLSGDTLGFNEKQVTTWAYECGQCGLIWAKRWYAEECGKRGHVKSFDQHYTYRVEGFMTHGQYAQKTYTRYSLGRDKRFNRQEVAQVG